MTCNNHYTVEPSYNAVVGVHDFGQHCKRGALDVPISATRELLNNSEATGTVCWQHCLYTVYTAY